VAGIGIKPAEKSQHFSAAQHLMAVAAGLASSAAA